MASPSPVCRVKDGSGAYTTTKNGVDVTPGNTVTINLTSSAGVTTWSIQCITTDELSVAATVNASLVIDPVAKTATFTAPAAGRAYRFQSMVNAGIGPDNTFQSSYVTTFCIYTTTTLGRRVHAVDETFESDATYGWLKDFNDMVRNPFAGSYLTAPTGTGFLHVTSGSADAAAKLVADADVSTTAAISASKLAASATKGEVIETFDSGSGAAARWGKRFPAMLANSSTGTLNDVASTDSNSNPVGGIRFSGAAPSVTGIAGGYDGRRIVLHTTGGPLVLKNSNASSSSANRIITGSGSDLTISNGGSALLNYDPTSAMWRVVASGPISVDIGAFLAASPAIGTPTITGGSMSSGTFSNPTLSGAITISSFTSTTTTSSDGKVTTVDALVSAQTTTGTQTAAYTSGTLADEAVHTIDVIVTAIKSDGSAAARYKRSYSGRRDGGSWTQLAAASDNGTEETTSTWDCTLDVSSNTFRVLVTGAASNTIRWGVAARIQSTVP